MNTNTTAATSTTAVPSRKNLAYTAKEDKMLRDGATMLPGRTVKAVYQRRRQLGLVKKAAWNPDELELAKQNIVPAGRTKAALRCVRNKLGLNKKTTMTANGQMELTLAPVSAHTNQHISDIVGKFVKTVNILRKSGMTVADIAEQTGKTKEQVQNAINLSDSLRSK